MSGLPGSRDMCRGDAGQTIVLFGVLLPVLFAMLGLAVDVGRLYVAKRNLQSATDAAALAAAANLPDGTQALIDACTFSATPSGGSCPAGTATADGKNVHSLLGNVSTSAQLECLSFATAGANCTTGTGCSGVEPPSGSVNYPGCNAIKVTQTTTVPTLVLGFLGFAKTTVSTSSTASMAGGRSSPLNVEVIVDSTGSMQDADNCGASPPASGVTGIPYVANRTPTAEDCAKAGVRALLETLYPCLSTNSQSLITCGTATGDNYAQPEDEVGLMTVPPPVGNPSAANYVDPGNGLGIPAETNCIDDLSGSNPSYFTTSPTTGNYQPSQNPQYKIVPLSSDYKTSDATSPANDSLLNPSSNLVKAVYWGQCPGGVYPTNDGSETSSLSTPGASDYSTANNNNSSPIAGGPNASGYSTATSNGGASAVSGFPTAGDSTTTNGSSASPSIAIARPGSPAANDYVVVAITTAGSGSNGVLVCAPDSTWTQLSQQHDGTGASRITQAVFGSVRSSASAESYSFSFVDTASTSSSACPSSPAVSLKASAVAVRYTGVDPYDPVDSIVTPQTSGGAKGKTLIPPSVTTDYANTRVVSFYSDGATALSGLNASRSVTQASTADITGVLDTTQAGPGVVTPSQATTASNNYWVTGAIALKPMQGSSSISVTRPTPAAANDYVIVSVTATDVGSSGSLYVCPPSDGTWTTISEKTQKGSGTTTDAVTQAVFGSLRSSSSDPAYTFTFADGTSCSGSTPAAVEASAVAVRYTGVDVGNPVDASGTPGGGTSGVSGSAVTAPAITTSHTGDQVVRVYSDAGTSLTLQGGQSAGQVQTNGGSSNVTLVTDKSQAAAGSTGTATATTAAAHNWVAQTIALEPQQGQATITINRPSNPAAGDLLVVSVTVQGQVSICAPDASWTDVGTGAVASGTGPSDVTTEAFYSYRSTQDPTGQAYTFSFKNGTCGSGTAVARPATAVAVRYTGANPAAPIETSASTTGTGTTLTTPTVTTGNINDGILSLYASSATSFSSGVTQSVSSTDTASAAETTVQNAPGTTSAQSAVASASTPWVALTVAVAAANGGCSPNSSSHTGYCAYGLEDPGGASTYYADAITAAKTALDAAAASRPDAKKVIILLSDGVGNISPYSTRTPCQDAVNNAITAETATSTTSAATIYAIAYGQSSDQCEDSSWTGICAMRVIADNPVTDTTHGLSGSTVANAKNTLCSGSMASDPTEHYYVQPNGTDLASVFRAIGLSLTSPRLVSDNAV